TSPGATTRSRPENRTRAPWPAARLVAWIVAVISGFTLVRAASGFSPDVVGGHRLACRDGPRRDAVVGGAPHRVGRRRVGPRRRVLPRHAVVVVAVAPVRRGLAQRLHRLPVGHAGLRALVEGPGPPGRLRRAGPRARSAARALGPRPAARRRARHRRGRLAARPPGARGALRVAVPGRRRRDPTRGIAVLPARAAAPGRALAGAAAHPRGGGRRVRARRGTPA